MTTTSSVIQSHGSHSILLLRKENTVAGFDLLNTSSHDLQQGWKRPPSPSREGQAGAQPFCLASAPPRAALQRPK